MNHATSPEFIAQLQADPLATVAAYYASCLAGHPKASRVPATQRLVRPGRLFAQSGLRRSHVGQARTGKNHRTWQAHSPTAHRAGHLSLQRSRTLSRHGYHSATFGSSGQVTGIYGRRIDMSNGGEIEQHIGSGIFNAQALQQFEEMIVSDSLLDAWTFYAAGTPTRSAQWTTR